MELVGGQPSRVIRTARISNSIAFGAKGYIFAVLLAGLPQLRDRHSLSHSSIVAAIFMISLLAAVGSRMAGALARRWSSRTGLRIGLALTAVSTAAIALAPNTTALFIGLGGYGITTGIVNASTIMQHALIEHRYGAFVMASFYATWAVGSILGALFIAASVKVDVALRESMLAAAVVILVVCLVTGPLLLRPQRAETNPAKAKSAAAKPSITTPLRAYLPFGIALVMVFAIDLGINNWSALYLTDELASSTSTAALPIAAFQFTSLAGLLTGDRWVRRFGPRTVMRSAAGMAVVGMLMAVSAPNPAVAIVGFGVCGIGLPLITPLCFSEAATLASGRARDALIARLNVFPYAGTLAGGTIVGLIATQGSLRFGIASLLAFALVLSIFGRAFRTRTLSESGLAKDPAADDAPEPEAGLERVQHRHPD
ncbi:MFS transporter [Nocardia brasiliensis]|uniref:MFS transporter n=1 Tax=Nocardia brasiliensis TaxID=37326 RepID=UPI00366D1538